MSQYSEFDHLLSRYLDGSASAADVAALETQLAADEQFAEHFAQWCLAHRQISELLTESKLHDLMDQFSTSMPGLPKEALRDQRERSAKSSSWTQSLAWAGLAGAILVAAAWYVTDTWIPAPLKDLAAKPAAADANGPEIVATLTQIVDGVWEPGAPALHYGQPLRLGDQVALKSGMVKITYDCGAEIVLQGPCDYWMHAPMEGYLASGRITANVPRRAFSFAILSPQVDMVDLGTSFGVEVGSRGRTELHVFEGEVLCSEPSKHQAGQRNEVIHVTANKAMEFGSESGHPSDITMNQEPFSQLMALRRAADIAAGHLVEDSLALWLAADVAVTTDPVGRVIAWQDIVYGDNKSGEDALQIEEKARPLLVKDAIHGQPAIRFDGESDYLLTTPLETTDDQTVMFVCKFGPPAFRKDRKWGGQIINYDGPEPGLSEVKTGLAPDQAERTRFLSNTLVPGVLQIGEPLLEQEFKPSMLTGQVFAGFIGSATVESGRVDAMSVGRDKPVIVTYVYDYEYEHGKSYLMINGKKYGEARAFAPQGVTSRKIIGRHAWMELFFGGDLGEMLIYNKALSAEELAETTAYLADKYQIKLDE
jgi:hypothetical protein